MQRSHSARIWAFMIWLLFPLLDGCVQNKDHRDSGQTRKACREYIADRAEYRDGFWFVLSGADVRIKLADIAPRSEPEYGTEFLDSAVKGEIIKVCGGTAEGGAGGETVYLPPSRVSLQEVLVNEHFAYWR